MLCCMSGRKKMSECDDKGDVMGDVVPFSPVSRMFTCAKPYTRWWWFSHTPLLENDIKYQLDWLKQNGFGGVELQWTRKFDMGIQLPKHRNGPMFIDDQWKKKVEYAKSYAAEIGLGCDFTFGTLWPFGGTFVSDEDSMRTFRGELFGSMSESSFEYPKRGNVLNHLSRRALENYSKVMGGALQNALKGEQSALFCDSWEIHSRQMWDPEMYPKFEQKFGYDFTPHASIDAMGENPDFRYDYRRMLSCTVTEEFYKAFTDIAHSLNSVTRVQCHGSPTDLLLSYSSVDIPESETLLFPVRFSRIPASAAALAGRPVTSCETFTCIYGFPSWYFLREFIGDMKLLADAVMAHGVNRIVYHGMPYNGPSTKHTFYATTHIGPNSPFASSLPSFNAYLKA